MLPAGNVIFIASQEAADEAGPDFGDTIEKVQGNLSLEVMQELNSRVDIDKEKPAEQAAQSTCRSSATSSSQPLRCQLPTG